MFSTPRTQMKSGHSNVFENNSCPQKKLKLKKKKICSEEYFWKEA